MAGLFIDERAETRWSSGIPAEARVRWPTPIRSHRQSVGRQPAEGGARPLAGAQAQGADRRRADPRHRRRRQGRGPPGAFDMARGGIAIIVISSELPEVMAISDRIVTIREGRITGEIRREEATEEQLMQMDAGAGRITCTPRRRRRRAGASARWPSCNLGGRFAARKASLLWLLRDFRAARAALPEAAQPVQRHAPGLDLRPARDRHDLRHPDPRHRPLGGLGRGARRAWPAAIVAKGGLESRFAVGAEPRRAAGWPLALLAACACRHRLRLAAGHRDHQAQGAAVRRHPGRHVGLPRRSRSTSPAAARSAASTRPIAGGARAMSARCRCR